jgi:glycosyltransferase involved in cell wall biosynthesis
MSDEPFVSLCVIARDEAASLARCLESARSVVDEMVVVDTGSTDSTVHEARRRGARVVSTPWQDDFAAARNVALDHARGVWVLSLDADEVLPPATAARLRPTLVAADAPALRVPIENIGASAAVESVQCAVRVFRRAPAHRWRGTVHEQVEVARSADALLPIVHHGYADRAALRRKRERNRTLLERQAAAAPDDVATAFHLAETRLALDDAAGAATLAQASLARVAQDAPLALVRLDVLAVARATCGELDAAADACRLALALRPEWIDPRLLLGVVSRRAGRAREAVIHLGRYLADRDRLAADPTWPARLPRLRTLGAEAQARAELALVHASLGVAVRARHDRLRAATPAAADASPARVRTPTTPQEGEDR